MDSTLEYLTRTHADIVANGYGRYHCGLVGAQVAKRLLAEGQTPHLELTYEEVQREGRTIVKPHVPLFLQDRMEPWHAHIVCCTDTEVFDPLVGEPVPKGAYTVRLFGEEIAMKMRTPPEEMAAYVEMWASG